MEPGLVDIPVSHLAPRHTIINCVPPCRHSSGDYTSLLTMLALTVPCLVRKAGAKQASLCTSSVHEQGCGRVGMEVDVPLEVDVPGCRQTHWYVDQEENASVREQGGGRMCLEVNPPSRRWTCQSMDEDLDVPGGRWMF